MSRYNSAVPTSSSRWVVSVSATARPCATSMTAVRISPADSAAAKGSRPTARSGLHAANTNATASARSQAPTSCAMWIGAPSSVPKNRPGNGERRVARSRPRPDRGAASSSTGRAGGARPGLRRAPRSVIVELVGADRVAVAACVRPRARAFEESAARRARTHVRRQSRGAGSGCVRRRGGPTALREPVNIPCRISRRRGCSGSRYREVVASASVDDEEQIVRAAVAGDRAALAAFVRDTQDHVWRYCAYLGRGDDVGRSRPGDLRAGAAGAAAFRGPDVGPGVVAGDRPPGVCRCGAQRAAPPRASKRAGGSERPPRRNLRRR